MTIFNKRQLVAGLLVFLIALTSLFVFSGLTSVKWPFAEGSPLSLKPNVAVIPPVGSLLINASYVANGTLYPIADGGVSVSPQPSNGLLYLNLTQSNGQILYTIPPGNYLVSLNSKHGVARDLVGVYPGSTTVFDYVSLNESEDALSFDVVSQQPGFAAPWDSIYVQIPAPVGGLNISAASVLVLPLYLDRYSNVTNSTAANLFFRKFPVPGPFRVQVNVISSEISSSGYLWVSLRPDAAFPLNQLLGLRVLEYQPLITVKIYKGVSS